MLAEPPPSRALDLAVGIVGLWLAGGLIFDSWAHLQIGVESFFTPYHALFYSAMLAGGAALTTRAVLNMRLGFPYARSLPVAYRRALLGVPLFVLGAFGDFVWHRFILTEDRIEAVTSPTHLLLGLGVVVLATGPVSSAFENRAKIVSLRDQLPLIFALATILEFIHLGTSYGFDPGAAREFAPPAAVPDSPDYFTVTTVALYKSGSGLLIVTLQSAVVAAFALWIRTRFALAFGAFTILFVLGETMLAAAEAAGTALLGVHAGMALAAGLTADIFVRSFPARSGRSALRLFGVLVPSAYAGAYFALTAVTGGIWWTWSLILGSICWAGLAGLALALIAENASTRTTALAARVPARESTAAQVAIDADEPDGAKSR